MFQTYDAERGQGLAAAARYKVTSYPTLIVLDAEGNEKVRQLGPPTPLPDWLRSSALVLASDEELVGQLKVRPNDTATMWLLYKRARARGDEGAATWLDRIEAADASPDKRAAAAAAWERIEVTLADGVRRDVRARMLDYVRKYPGRGERALPLLAASGVDKKIVEAELARVVDATSDPGVLNGLTYSALGMGALDAALRAAEKQRSLLPDDANSYDTLAEVYNYRGDRAKAVETEKKGMAMKVPPPLLAAMQANLKRFETGGASPDVPAAAGLRSPLSVDPGPPAAAQNDPKRATETMFRKKAAELGAKCKAKGMTEAYVRIHVGKTAVDKVELLEPGAPATLKRCLDQAVRTVAIPADTQPTRLTMPIPLG